MIETDRLVLRPTEPQDRKRFVELFGDESFMVYSGGVLAAQAANERFDVMLANAMELPYAKQPVIDGSTGQILGYSGVAWFEFDGKKCQEFGYRLCESARGHGFATEAGLALLERARSVNAGLVYAMIDPRNQPSQRVADKLGFTFWKMATVGGYLDRLYRIDLYADGVDPNES